MSKKFPANPKNPERICWGCDRYCPVGSLACGNGAERTQHPAELFGEDWQDWGLNAEPAATVPTTVATPVTGPDGAAAGTPSTATPTSMSTSMSTAQARVIPIIATVPAAS